MSDDFGGIESIYPTRDPPIKRLRQRIAAWIEGSAWPKPPPPSETTVTGLSQGTLEDLSNPFYRISSERKALYNDVRQMDGTVDEVATALDMLADNAVATQSGGKEPFTIAYVGMVSKWKKDMIEGLLARTRYGEKAYEIARGTLRDGDDFRQYVIDENFNIVRLMYMPPESMVRNEDASGLLLMGEKQGEWAYEQYNPITERFIAGFKPYEILHSRWNRSGASAYGRSLISTARTSWRKLQSMEEALVINWITRAIARLLFTLDVTGKSPKEAQAAIREFMRSLQTRRIAKDVEGVEQLSIVKDICIGRSYHEMGGKTQEGLTDVKVLDTSSTGYMNLSAIDYYRSKIIMSLRTPKAYLGLEEDVNAKATLVQEDRRYAKFIMQIQALLTLGIRQTIDLQLALQGVDPTKVQYIVDWPAQGWTDLVERSEALLNYAKADEILLPMKLIDREHVATTQMNMSSVQWDAMKERIEDEPPVPVQELPGAAD